VGGAVPKLSKSCGKTRFRDHKQAVRALHVIANSYLDLSGEPTAHRRFPVRSYECPECSGWHLTSQPDGWR